MTSFSLNQQDALLIVDLQYDFLSGGSLAVPYAEKIIPVLNRYIEIFSHFSLPIFASRDWHPADHCSFQRRGGQWSAHCIAGSHGARLSTDLKIPARSRIISKAVEADQEAYSALDGTELNGQLKDLGIKRLFIGGLATDFCVLYTVKEALAAGYQVMVLQDAIQAVNLNADDGDRARAEMRDLGAIEITISRIEALR